MNAHCFAEVSIALTHCVHHFRVDFVILNFATSNTLLHLLSSPDALIIHLFLPTVVCAF